MARLTSSIVLMVATTASGSLAAASCSSSSSTDTIVDAGSDVSMSALDSGGGDGSVSPHDAGARDASDASDVSLPDGGCPSDGGIPNDLYCTGLYSDWATKTIATDALAYTPGLVFWSDGAIKNRWIYLPPGSKIDTSNPDDWTFPTGTKIWKQFALGSQIIETRLLWKTDDSDWTFLDYRWSADGSTATQLVQGETNVSGTTYEVPATNVCSTCHAGRNDDVLGFDFIGLGVAGAQGVTLATLTSGGQLTKPLPTTTVTIPEDSTGKAAAALGWLHVNCGTACHNSNLYANAVQTHLYMKLLASELYPADGGTAHVDQLDTYTSSVNVTANLVPDGLTYVRVVPGDAGASLMPLMDLARGGNSIFEQMPPIVSHEPDEAGVALVQAWIGAL